MPLKKSAANPNHRIGYVQTVTRMGERACSINTRNRTHLLNWFAKYAAQKLSRRGDTVKGLRLNTPRNICDTGLIPFDIGDKQMANDKCDLCALKVIFDQDNVRKAHNVENFIKTLRDLQSKNIIERGYNRRIYASNDGSGDKSEMCAINSPFFLKDNKDKRCPDFILNMDLQVPEALFLNVARSTDRLTANIHKITIIVMWIAGISCIIGLGGILVAILLSPV